jgi:hypothetical protein
VAVAVISFTDGYIACIPLLEWIGVESEFLLWIVGLVVGVALAIVVLLFDLQKYAIIVITALGGTGFIVYTILAMVYGTTLLEFVGNPVTIALDQSWLWFLFFVIVAGLGVYFQWVANRSFEVESYNRVADENWNYM